MERLLGFVSLPTTPTGLYRWNVCLFVLYLLVAVVVDWTARARFGPLPERRLKPADWLFNGATFSASAMLIIGIFDSDVLRLIGDTTGYLAIAAIAGLGYSLQALKPRR